jgi:O-acetyl-ADP-ribose deacetylase (regulator of RNase III)
MPFEIVRNDITNMHVDAIVNAASRFPRVNAGVDSAIHKKAGPALLEARKTVGYIEPSSAAITPAFNLDAQFVIHAATPTWKDGLQKEPLLLRETYDHCLDLAVKHNCSSIAFPLLASGNHGFPKGKALQVAISAFSEFLLENEMQIYLVVFSKDSVQLSEKLVQHVSSYIDEHYISQYEQEMYGSEGPRTRRERYHIRRNLEMREACKSISEPCAASVCEPSKADDLDSFLKKKEASFVAVLLDLIKKSGQKNSTIYKKANLSKQHFSKLINTPDVAVTKTTAVSLALALELDLEQTKELLSHAGYTLSNSSVFDLIIQYYIERKKYNVVEINLVLYEFDQSLLGSQVC